MDIIKTISKELEIKTWQAEAVIKLIDEGNTIPFIARYRKEATGSLNDEVLRDFHDRLVYLRNLEEKKAQVLSSINDQGKLTPELKKMIEEALTMVAVDDLYRPYRPKRRTRAIIAKEKGLEPLANILMLQMTSKSMLEEAKMFVSDQKGVATAEEALNGAKDILAEAISDNADYRTYIRRITMNEGKVVSKARDINEKSVYENYYDYEEAVSKMPSHRILAINRGEKLKFLTVKVEAPEEKIIRYLEKKVIRKDNPETEFILRSVVEDSYNRLIGPSVEREVRNELTERAEEGGMKDFGKNLKQLLMQPPISGRVVLGWDPAFRTGCKLAVVDATGKILDTVVIYPTEPQKKIKEAKEILKRLIGKYVDFSWKRYGLKRIRNGHCGAAERIRYKGRICDRK